VAADTPDAFPEPPPDLAQRRLPIAVHAGAPLYRNHKRQRSPLYFNRAVGRFAPPDDEAFGVLYLGEDEYAAFIKGFSQGVGSSPLGLFISQGLLHQNCLCVVGVGRSLRLVDLTSGAALKRLAANADSRIGDGPHAISRRWAAALWAHSDQPDGLIYLARNAPDHRSIALFDRAADAVAADCAENLLLDPARLGRILEHFGCAVIP
jgi:hypothetical protein